MKLILYWISFYLFSFLIHLGLIFQVPQKRPILEKIKTEPSSSAKGNLNIWEVEGPKRAKEQKQEIKKSPPLVQRPIKSKEMNLSNENQEVKINHPKIIPQYPWKSRLLKEEGIVILKVDFVSDGRIKNIQILKSSGFPRLDREALNAVKNTSYNISQNEIKNIYLSKTFHFQFSLKNN